MAEDAEQQQAKCLVAPVTDMIIPSESDANALRAIAVVGPTACGKTHRAVQLASILNGEIISADSRQVYRNMDLGTGKDLYEYGDIRYHLIDICAPGSKYNLHKYLRDFNQTYHDMLARGKRPVICGGSGMYVEHALNGISLPEVPENSELRHSLSHKSLDQLADILSGYKQLHNVTDIDTRSRAIRAIEIQYYYLRHPEAAISTSRRNAKPIDALIIGLDIPREERRARISQRLQQRLADGLIREIQDLLNSGIDAEDLIYYGLEYKYVTLHVMGELSYQEMFNQLETSIHQFAKRQMTWFRGMERRGSTIHWLPYDLDDTEFETRVQELL